MKHTRLLLLIIISFVFRIHTFGQGFDVVPKVKSLETGMRYMANSSLNINPVAWTAQADVMWQVSGFENKRPAYISIPLGFSQFIGGGSDSALNASIMHYGWTIRHNLARDKKWIPVLSYNLLLNQVWIEGYEGRVMGHETRFDFGYEYHPDNSKMYYFFKVEYSHASFPALGKEKSDKMDIAALKMGILF